MLYPLRPAYTSQNIYSHGQQLYTLPSWKLTPIVRVLLVSEILKGVEVSDSCRRLSRLFLLVAVYEEPSNPEEVYNLGPVQTEVDVEGRNVSRGPVVIKDLSLESAHAILESENLNGKPERQ
jgi:hypothetical protein